MSRREAPWLWYVVGGASVVGLFAISFYFLLRVLDLSLLINDPSTLGAMEGDVSRRKALEARLVTDREHYVIFSSLACIAASSLVVILIRFRRVVKWA
jgi:hypothetical protein